MPRIDKVAFFGDSYCFDTITKKQKNGTEVFYYPASETYLDIFANKIGADIVHNGTPGHGPNWMVHELRTWLSFKSQQYINETHFVFLWSDQSREIMPNTGVISDDNKSFEEKIHPGEIALPGPDSPMIKDKERFDQRVRNAIELYWLYLKPRGGSGEHYRQFQTCRDAWKFYLQRYSITSYQQYHCFFHTAEYENNTLAFEYEGVKHNCLQHFAHSMDDYVQGENRDLAPEFQDHYNHFSPKGQYNMADVLLKNYRESNV